MKEIEIIINGDKLERVKRMLPKVSVRTVVADDLVDPIVNEMVSSMGNATFGDGKMFIKDVAEAIRVRTGETGDAAL